MEWLLVASVLSTSKFIGLFPTIPIFDQPISSQIKLTLAKLLESSSNVITNQFQIESID